jgi:hypothetical protein
MKGVEWLILESQFLLPVWNALQLLDLFLDLKNSVVQDNLEREALAGARLDKDPKLCTTVTKTIIDLVDSGVRLD